MKPENYFDKLFWKFGFILEGGAWWKVVDFPDGSEYRKLFAGIYWRIS